MKGADWVVVALLLFSMAAALDAMLWPLAVILDAGVLAAGGYILWSRRRAESRPVLEATKPK